MCHSKFRFFLYFFLSTFIAFLFSILTLKYFIFTLNFVCIQHFGTLNVTFNDRILHRVEQNIKFLNPATSNEVICLLIVVRVLVCATNPLNNPTTLTG